MLKSSQLSQLAQLTQMSRCRDWPMKNDFADFLKLIQLSLSNSSPQLIRRTFLWCWGQGKGSKRGRRLPSTMFHQCKDCWRESRVLRRNGTSSAGAKQKLIPKETLGLQVSTVLWCDGVWNIFFCHEVFTLPRRPYSTRNCSGRWYDKCDKCVWTSEPP